MIVKRFSDNSVLVTSIEKPYMWVSKLHEMFPESIEIVPAFQEILLVFKTKTGEIADIENKIKAEFDSSRSTMQSAQLVIPICFDKQFALDAERVEQHTGLTYETIVNKITNTTFAVEFLGFLPGFPYMSGLAEKLTVPRLDSPRNQIIEGSFAIAENQTGIYPMMSPGGWNILGNCPVNLFDVERLGTTLFLPGDQVELRSVSISEHKEIKASSITRKMLLK